MNRQLKKMINECSALSDKLFGMTIQNSSEEERDEVLTALHVKRKEIAYKCAEILGVKDEDDAKVIGASIDRGKMLDYLRFR